MNFPPHSSALAADLAEAELQAELREMFVVDTQQHLDSYFALGQQLNAGSWTSDIQHIYRAIHTIKGGAVTVEADGVLYAATALEDLLSDLRYLDVAPPLADGQLAQMLLEAGELLASTMEIGAIGENAAQAVAPTLERLQELHQQVKQQYLSDWSEQRQLHQEFADQGFELVVLDLELTLKQLAQGPIDNQIRQVGIATVHQLMQIGEDIALDRDWVYLLDDFLTWLVESDGPTWTAQLTDYLHLLQDCVRHSGVVDEALRQRLLELMNATAPGPNVPSGDAPSWDAESTWDELELLAIDDLGATATSALPPIVLPEPELDLWADNDWDDVSISSWDEDTLDQELQELEEDLELEDLVSPAAEQAPLPWAMAEQADLDILESVAEAIDLENSADLALELPDSSRAIDDQTIDLLDEILDNDQLFSAPAAAPAPNLAETRRQIQVPVPLERLDLAAQEVADTLLTARGLMGFTQQLQGQLAQLTDLTNETAKFITHLRQIQDDYALLRQYSNNEPTGSVTLERYRQGYGTINRLLENILRMSELGREIETANHHTSTNLSQLDRHILQLKDRVEASRLVPFRNLTLRARAILRDLTNRYKKSAELVVINENIELDAGVVQQLEPVMLHLIRNAYDHGLEAKAARLAAGKPAGGIITLELQRRGNVYLLAVSDDGGGINASEIARKAQAKGFGITNTGTAAGLLAVLCQPGLSSRDTVSEVSGRGVGMDVVASQVEAMGGKLSLKTALGQGTTFTIEIPASQLLVSCVLVQVGDRVIALPSEEVIEVLFIDGQATLTEAGWQIRRGEDQQTVAWPMHHYWQQSLGQLSEGAIAIRSRWGSFDQVAEWLIADALIGQTELLLSPLPYPIVPPAGMLGVSLQPDGQLVTVFDPGLLLSKLRFQTGDTTVAATSVPRAASGAKILVVDDAALMRRRIESSLNTHGYETQSCGDGLEALQWIQAHGAPLLMITDIEMPNMDGFTLLDRCRQEGLTMPVVVISSRLSEEWSREAQRLGANQYLNKGFKTAELIETVEALVSLQLA